MWALCETYRVLDICILGIAEALSLVSSWHTLPMVLKKPYDSGGGTDCFAARGGDPEIGG